MAGDNNHLRLDPAIDRWAAMRENVYQHFKFTRRATKTVALYGIVFPLSLFVLARATDAKFDWAGKTRGESLRGNPTKEVKPVEA